MSDTKTMDQVYAIFNQSLETLRAKNEDYGDAWRFQGWRGNLPRIFEKANRVRNLLWRADPMLPSISKEAAVDTLRDMLNTIAFAIVNIEEGVEWGHETPNSERIPLPPTQFMPGNGEPWRSEVGSTDVVIPTEITGGAIDQEPTVKRRGRPVVSDNPQA